MQTYKQVFQTATPWEQATYGRMIVLIETPNPVDLKIYNAGGREVYSATGIEAGFWTVPEEPFSRFVVSNDYAGGMVKVGVSQSEKGGYNRVGGKIDARTISAQSVINVPFKSVLQNTETLLAAANPGRASLRIWNNGTADIFLGAPGLNINDAAIKLAPGDLWIEESAAAAAWVALQSTAAAQPVKVQEVVW